MISALQMEATPRPFVLPNYKSLPFALVHACNCRWVMLSSMVKYACVQEQWKRRNVDICSRCRSPHGYSRTYFNTSSWNLGVVFVSPGP